MIELTPEQESMIANAIRTNKPYILALEEQASDIDYGTIDVRMEVRAGVIEKMSFFSSKTWLRDKSS